MNNFFFEENASNFFFYDHVAISIYFFSFVMLFQSENHACPAQFFFIDNEATKCEERTETDRQRGSERKDGRAMGDSMRYNDNTFFYLASLTIASVLPQLFFSQKRFWGMSVPFC